LFKSRHFIFSSPCTLVPLGMASLHAGTPKELAAGPDAVGKFDNWVHNVYHGLIKPGHNSVNCVDEALKYAKTVNLETMRKALVVAQRLHSHDEEELLPYRTCFLNKLMSCDLSNLCAVGERCRHGVAGGPDAVGRFDHWVHNVYIGQLSPGRNLTNCVDEAMKYAAKTKNLETMRKVLVVALRFQTHDEDDISTYEAWFYQELLSRDLSYLCAARDMDECSSVDYEDSMNCCELDMSLVCGNVEVHVSPCSTVASEQADVCSDVSDGEEEKCIISEPAMVHAGRNFNRCCFREEGVYSDHQALHEDLSSACVDEDAHYDIHETVGKEHSSIDHELDMRQIRDCSSDNSSDASVEMGLMIENFKFHFSSLLECAPKEGLTCVKLETMD